MNLNAHHQQLISQIDEKMKLIKDNKDHAVFNQLTSFLPVIRNMLTTVHEKQIELYLYTYQGFQSYVLTFMRPNGTVN